MLCNYFYLPTDNFLCLYKATDIVAYTLLYMISSSMQYTTVHFIKFQILISAS